MKAENKESASDSVRPTVAPARKPLTECGRVSRESKPPHLHTSPPPPPQQPHRSSFKLQVLSAMLTPFYPLTLVPSSTTPLYSISDEQESHTATLPVLQPMPNIQLKTAVNTRASLASRLPKKKTEAQTFVASLHQTAETTYDTTYLVPPPLPRIGTSAAVHGGVAADFTTGSHSPVLFDPTAGGPEGREERQSTSSLHPQQEQQQQQPTDYNLHTHTSSAWQSVSHATSRNVQPDQQLGFYADVRKLEQVADDKRIGLVGSVQRSLDIRTKRAEDDALRPQCSRYVHTEPLPMSSLVAQERFGAKRNFLDLVECTQLKPQTEEQLGFGEAPMSRLPGDTLSQELTVQSKVITQMGTSHELFRGTPKYVSNATVGYGGHVPAADRNLAAMHQGDDAQRLFAKSHMTLAEHGGSVDAAACGPSITARRRRGSNAKASRALPPKSSTAINQTAQGRMQQTTLYGTLKREQQMNVRDDGQVHNYF